MARRKIRKTRQVDEYLLDLVLEPLAEGGYVATSRQVQGLVAQGRTVAETVEIARDVARKIIESCIEHGDPIPKLRSSREGKLGTTVSLGLGG